MVHGLGARTYPVLCHQALEPLIPLRSVHALIQEAGSTVVLNTLCNHLHTQDATHQQLEILTAASISHCTFKCKLVSLKALSSWDFSHVLKMQQSSMQGFVHAALDALSPPAQPQQQPQPQQLQGDDDDDDDDEVDDEDEEDEESDEHDMEEGDKPWLALSAHEVCNAFTPIPTMEGRQSLRAIASAQGQANIPGLRAPVNREAWAAIELEVEGLVQWISKPPSRMEPTLRDRQLLSQGTVSSKMMPLISSYLGWYKQQHLGASLGLSIFGDGASWYAWYLHQEGKQTSSTGLRGHLNMYGHILDYLASALDVVQHHHIMDGLKATMAFQQDLSTTLAHHEKREYARSKINHQGKQMQEVGVRVNGVV